VNEAKGEDKPRGVNEADGSARPKAATVTAPPVSCIAWLGVAWTWQRRGAKTLESRESKSAARATTDEKLEATKRTKPREAETQRRVEKCGAMALETLALATDPKLE